LILQPSQISIFENIFLQLSFFKVSKLTGDWSYNLRDFLILAKKYLHNFPFLES
jgi:hypothetical protein